MKQHDDSLMTPPLEDLLDRIPQKFELVLTATKRAKQIIREQRLNPAAYPATGVESKPLTIALHEIFSGRVDKDSLLRAPEVEADDFFEEEPDILSDIERGRAAFTTSGEEGFPAFEDDDEDAFEDDDEAFEDDETGEDEAAPEE